MFDEFAPTPDEVRPELPAPPWFQGPAKRYAGIRWEFGCYVYADGWRLQPDRSLKVRNHSPTGFNWGYGGSGPAQLALALLLHEGLSDTEAQFRYQRLKSAIVAGFTLDAWTLDGDFLRDWIKEDREIRAVPAGWAE